MLCMQCDFNWPRFSCGEKWRGLLRAPAGVYIIPFIWHACFIFLITPSSAKESAWLKFAFFYAEKSERQPLQADFQLSHTACSTKPVEIHTRCQEWVEKERKKARSDTLRDCCCQTDWLAELLEQATQMPLTLFIFELGRTHTAC